MDIKSEIGIKIEVFDADYDFSQQDSQNFPNNEESIPLLESVKIEEVDQHLFIKSEIKDLEKQFMLDEKHLVEDVESKDPLMVVEMSSTQCIKTCINVACQEGEKSSKMKHTLRSRAQRFKKKHGENFICIHCNFNSKSEEELQRHIKTHSKGKYKCSHCSFKFEYKSQLKVHSQIHTDIKLFKCSKCSFECNVKRKLKKHMLVHGNTKKIKLFKCSQCSYECSRKDRLEIHMLVHRKIKLFKCSECSYECNYEIILRMHMLVHKNKKSVKCPECNYACNQKRQLKTHMLNHENIKFKCTECDREYKHKGRLKQHLLVHRKGENIKINPHNETNFSLPENIKIEVDENIFAESELRDLHAKINPENETNICLPENIKIEVDENIFVESGLRDLEEEVDTSMRFEDSTMVAFPYNLRNRINNVDQEEKSYRIEHTLENKPQESAKQDQIPEMYQEYLCCRYCHFCFKSKDELESHLKTHINGWFKCAYCQCKFKSSSGLEFHLRTHK